MYAGQLRHTIILQSPETTKNAKGRTVTTYTDKARVQAAIADVSGREFYEAMAYHAQDITTFTIRWRSDVRADWRVVHNGRTYGIVEVNHLGYRGDFIRLKTKEITGLGGTQHGHDVNLGD